MTKIRPHVLALVILELCLLLLDGCISQRFTAAQVIQNAQKVLGEMHACHALLDVEIDTDMIKDVLSIEVWEKHPAHFKIQVWSAANPQLRDMAFSTDGSTSVSYSPHTNTATLGPADMVHMPQIIEELVRARREGIQATDPQKARLLAREREDGLVVYKVEVATGESRQTQYSIDAQQWLVRQVTYRDTYLGTGVIRLQTIECFNDLDDARFDLDIPDGTTLNQVSMADNRPLTLTEAQRAVDFRLRTPDYLPPETEFSVAYQIDKNMALVYTGDHAFTLVQGPNIGSVPQEDATQVPLHGRQATLIQDEERAGVLLTWREDDLQFSIAGSLDLNEVLQIAESLK